MNVMKSGCLVGMLTLCSVVPVAAQYYYNPYSIWNAPNFRAYPWVNATPFPYNAGPQLSHEPAQAQESPRWWCPAAHAYYPQVTFCQIGTWEAVYPPPTSPSQVSQSPPPQVTEKPVIGNAQFRCRDPNTNFVYERPEPCANRDEILSRFASSPAVPAQDVSNSGTEGETVEQDKIWNDRIEHGACTRLRDRRTDSPADIAECNRDYAMTPMCISYKGFAFAWFDMANDPNPVLSSPSFAKANLNTLGSKGDPADPPYYRSPQFHDVLRRLLNVAFSPARSKWSTRDQFADYAYKICMEGHPF
jgi:hypothetical protein